MRCKKNSNVQRNRQFPVGFLLEYPFKWFLCWFSWFLSWHSAAFTHTHTYKQTKGKHLYNMGPSMSISVNIWMINHITTGLFALIFRKGIRNSHCSTRFYCCCCCHVKIAFYSLIAKKPDKIGKKQQQWRHYNTHIKT